MDTFKVIVDNQEFDIHTTDAQSLDALPIQNGNQIHILRKNKAYHVEIESISDNYKEITYLINGTKYSVQVKDKFDALVDMMGFDKSDQKKINEIHAPMPGLILDILVQPGSTVEKGDSLLILEAMKMENVIKAEGEGIVKFVHLEKGAAVEKGQLIIEME